MKKLFTIVCLLAATHESIAVAQTTPSVQAPDCANATTQARMNDCAYEDFLSATAGYADSYKTLSKKLGTKQKDQFRRAQKLWVQYRTAACNFESSGVEGGSAQAMVKWQCYARMTRTRTAELAMLANCREGDLSCPRFKK
jgi:uncharacterized protein YecT (DUF1311 family)